MKKLSEEQIKNLNDFINNKIKEAKFKRKVENRKIILSVGTETLKRLKEMFSEK